ncbi:MAG: response regulator transcription factor [Flavobacteriales bacterium]|nr:response regulator transcription factor [Flavobacteriales bacterium]
MPHVILLEDDALVRAVLAHRMRGAGWQVTALPDGRDLESILRTSPAQLIVVDIGLPHVDGLALVEDLRARGIQVPVMVLTAYDQPHLLAAVRSAGANDLMQKPCDQEELIDRMERLLAA